MNCTQHGLPHSLHGTGLPCLPPLCWVLRTSCSSWNPGGPTFGVQETSPLHHRFSPLPSNASGGKQRFSIPHLAPRRDAYMKYSLSILPESRIPPSPGPGWPPGAETQPWGAGPAETVPCRRRALQIAAVGANWEAAAGPHTPAPRLRCPQEGEN